MPARGIGDGTAAFRTDHRNDRFPLPGQATALPGCCHAVPSSGETPRFAPPAACGAAGNGPDRGGDAVFDGIFLVHP